MVHVALLLVQLAFASGAIAGRLAFSGQGHVDPTALAFVRAAMGALAFQLASRLVKVGEDKPATRRQLRTSAITSVCSCFRSSGW